MYSWQLWGPAGMGPGDIFLIEAFRTNCYILGLMDDALNSNAIHTYSVELCTRWFSVEFTFSLQILTKWKLLKIYNWHVHITTLSGP